LSIVLSRYNVADAEKLLSRRIGVVSNGIPDPCPDFAASILPRRLARLAARKKLLAGEPPGDDELKAGGEDPQFIKVLFIAHCTREKGLFAAMAGVVAANRRLAAENSPLRMKLAAAGNFFNKSERAEFDRLLELPEYAGTVNHLGFVADASKKKALHDADVFCFPTQYLGENQPVNLIEAMAFGLPIVTTRWRSLPEMLPPGHAGLVPAPAPDEIAAALLRLALNEAGENLRDHFLAQFSLESHLAKLASAIQSVENSAPATALLPALRNS
jgi:glycosyltransferase involved in cell wall biosynthesis